MPNAEIIRAFLEQATAQGTRSTALKPLGWLVAMLLTATLASFYSDAPAWVGPTLCAFACVSIIAYLASYVYLMFTDKDALRSETYSLQKLAIEKGVYGDSIIGTVDYVDSDAPKLLNDGSSSTDEELNQ